jgi:GT2 family glycosyltransferase
MRIEQKLKKAVEKYPLISIVILNYNRLKYLKKVVPSVQNLNYPKKEIIVIDNGSNDGSVLYLETFANIKLIQNKENLGYSKGKNIGINHAKGEYILAIDNDIVLSNENLLLELLHNYKQDAGFLQIPILDAEKNETYYYGTFYGVYGMNMHRASVPINDILDSSNNLREIGGATGGFFFVQNEKWKQIGGFDESQSFHLDDVDIGPRAWILGYKNYLYTKTYAVHIGTEEVKKIQNYINRFKLLFSGHGRSMIKNYRLQNLFYCFPIFFLYSILKSIKYSVKKRDFRIFFAFLYSLFIFIKKLPNTLRARKIIQSKRKVIQDIFLSVKPPVFLKNIDNINSHEKGSVEKKSPL